MIHNTDTGTEPAPPLRVLAREQAELTRMTNEVGAAERAAEQQRPRFTMFSAALGHCLPLVVAEQLASDQREARRARQPIPEKVSGGRCAELAGELYAIWDHGQTLKQVRPRLQDLLVAWQIAAKALDALPATQLDQDALEYHAQAIEMLSDALGDLDEDIDRASRLLAPNEDLAAHQEQIGDLLDMYRRA